MKKKTVSRTRIEPVLPSLSFAHETLAKWNFDSYLNFFDWSSVKFYAILLVVAMAVLDSR